MQGDSTYDAIDAESECPPPVGFLPLLRHQTTADPHGALLEDQPLSPASAVDELPTSDENKSSSSAADDALPPMGSLPLMKQLTTRLPAPVEDLAHSQSHPCLSEPHSNQLPVSVPEMDDDDCDSDEGGFPAPPPSLMLARQNTTHNPHGGSHPNFS